MNSKLADWLLSNKHVSITAPVNPKIKVIWRSTGDVLFEDTEDKCLSWEGTEIWYVVEWTYTDNIFTVIVI